MKYLIIIVISIFILNSSSATNKNTPVGWNIIYDASKNRVIYPVSRIWNQNFGGHYVLFDWDTYFASYMASMESKELAYANAVEKVCL